MVLVTGANGFVGRPLCVDLARRGLRVRAVVRDDQRSRDLPGEIVPIGTMSAHTDWSSAMQGVHAVVHLAARVHVMSEHAVDPLSEFRAINVGVTEGLARAAARCGVERFVLVSSIKVNGEATAERSFTPEDPPAPRDPYGISKREAEDLLWRVAQETGLGVTIVRPPLVYGPEVRGNFLRLLRLIERGVPLPFGLVHNCRSMVYRENLTSALIACAIHPGAAGQTYLVSDGEDLSTRSLIMRLAQAMGTRALLFPVPVPLLTLAGALTGNVAEVGRLVGSLTVDNANLRRTLDWKPPFTVAEGLAETARWFSARQT